MSEDSYLSTISEHNNNDNSSSSDDGVDNNNEDNNLVNSSDVSHVLCTTNNTALPPISTSHWHASINSKPNPTSGCNNNNYSNSNYNNDNDAEEVIEDDASNNEIIGYCITYCDLTPSTIVQNANEGDNCSSVNTDALTE